MSHPMDGGGGARVYQYQPTEDGRDAIFAQWQQRDELTQTIQVETANTAISQVSMITSSDPPPDIYKLNQSINELNRQDPGQYYPSQVKVNEEAFL